MILLAFLLVLVVAGGVLFFYLFRNQKQVEVALLQEERKKTLHLEQQLEELRGKYLLAQKQISELSTQQQNQKNFDKQLRVQFEHLSQSILDKKSQQLQELSSEGVKQLLTPLNDTLHRLKTQVEETYTRHSQEQYSLKEKIRELCEVHGKLDQETKNLTQALKGDVRVQGRWGEVVLLKVLESSALVEGEHFFVQGRGLKAKNLVGQLQKPDVVVLLPEKKHIVIDAKVSLKHYEEFISSPDTEQKQQSLSRFIHSIKEHVRHLSGKQYHLSEAFSTPDFVLMFFPIEGAFSLALQNQPDIFQFAWEKEIVIVSPTTLLATLKTVASLWKIEKQNKNVFEIARLSGRLYDKFASFLSNMSDIGTQLKKAEASYSQACNQINSQSGGDCMISQMEKIKHLGAKTHKQIPDLWLVEPQSGPKP